MESGASTPTAISTVQPFFSLKANHWNRSESNSKTCAASSPRKNRLLIAISIPLQALYRLDRPPLNKNFPVFHRFFPDHGAIRALSSCGPSRNGSATARRSPGDENRSLFVAIRELRHLIGAQASRT